MPIIYLDPPLMPKNGSVLHVQAIDRISTRNQDPKSNDDQQALLRRWVAARYDGTVVCTVITGQDSGECIDRKQFRETEDAVTTGKYDQVIVADLGCHLRNAQAVDFCEQCENNDTRLIAINDSFDTLTAWRLHAFFAAMRHGHPPHRVPPGDSFRENI